MILLTTNGRKNYRWEKFKKYLPKYYFDTKQMQFFYKAFNTVMNDKDTDKVTCFSPRCGIGKSTFINTFINYCVGEKKTDTPIGIVVVTDSVKRLEELSSFSEFKEKEKEYWGEKYKQYKNYHYNNFMNRVIVLNSTESLQEQMQRQHYKPIVLLTTQRYFMMPDKLREQLFTYSFNNKSYKRNIVIFDERPQFFEQVSINTENLSLLESALYEGLNDEVRDKKFVTNQFREFKISLTDKMDELESMNENNRITMYWKDKTCNSITKNDQLFFKIINANMDSLTQKYSKFQRDMWALQEIMENGAIFNATKKRNGEYRRSFTVLRDNRDCFYLGEDKKFFVFDATAEIDPRYDVDYTKIYDTKKYNRPLNMTITNVCMNTAKGYLVNEKNADMIKQSLLSEVSKKLDESHKNKEDVLIVVYQNFKKWFKEYKYVGYFGNLKGFNDYKDLDCMAHVGINRFPNMVYFYIYCGTHMRFYRSLQDMTIAESIDFFNKIENSREEKDENDKLRRENTREDFLKLELKYVMLRSMLVDFEQNIFRLAIRNYDNKLPVHIWTFYDIGNEVYKNLSDMIEERYKPYGVTFTYEKTPEKLQIASVMNRKPPEGKKMTNAQKILQWREQLPKGTEYKIQQLLDETGLTDKQLQKAKTNNKSLKQVLDSDKTDKRGYYLVS